MAKKTNIQGGVRPGAGRKEYEKKEDLKEPITVYIKKSVISDKGGKPLIREKTIEFITNLPKIEKQN